MPNLSINTKSLILLWAFAESGIGGILHGLKLPFTGIFVGGIAVICIALLGFYDEQNNELIDIDNNKIELKKFPAPPKGKSIKNLKMLSKIGQKITACTNEGEIYDILME